MLVLLHEGLGSVAMWKSVPEDLASLTGCAVIAYSRYGNGFSEVLHEARALSYMHDEALEALPDVLNAFGVRDAVLVGQSDGASIALIYAGEIGARVRGVVVEAPHVFVEDISVRSIAQAKVAYESSELRKRLQRYHADADRTFYGWNDIWLHPEFRAWNIQDSVRKIRVPVLAIQGLDDEYGTMAQIDAIAGDACGARVDTLSLANCGHAPHRDRPDLTLPAVAAFVKSVTS
ncbi:MAG TPA: alpha/beta hydrolase [Candidatus Baltobacteraceae bacterium]|nr:alpha/beta hydrolase [Candidatus Baltobacteraceae bacterium]